MSEPGETVVRGQSSGKLRQKESLPPGKHSRTWVAGLLIGCLIPVLIWLVIKQTTLPLTSQDIALADKLGYDKADFAFVNNIMNRPTGRQTYESVKITEAEWSRLFTIAQGKDELRMRACQILCNCARTPKRDTIVAMAHKLLQKNNERDVSDGLMILRMFRTPDWRSQVDDFRNSPDPKIRELVKSPFFSPKTM